MIKINARECLFKKVDNDFADSFISDQHRHTKVLSSIKKSSFGLFHNGELVGVAQFCAPRTSKKKREYSTELLRLAFKKDTRVVGGASKIIKSYIDSHNPADIFTYQDATGEVTDVYEHAGFTFVSQEKKKEYLVAPGKTLETGNRKEVLGMAYATQYGPDRILGTKLGEVIDLETGKRKSNKRIFIEELGWHVETTPGDKVFEWFNPNMTHYVYKITATDSDKYYFGVSHVKKANATIEDCLNDGYYGTGGKKRGNKFINWKNKYKHNLVKEIVDMFDKKMDAYEFENKIIGDSYKEDPLCLNSVMGGVYGGLIDNAIAITMKNCAVHGETKHRGSICALCNSRNSVSIKFCSIHGETKYKGDSCYLCIADSSISEKSCAIHGESDHRGDKCIKCSSESAISTRFCDVHGESTHRGDSCVACYTSSVISVMNCDIHGDTSHRGDKCMNCISQNSISTDVCDLHGDTKFRGGKCVKCFTSSSNVIGNCSVHGETSFNGLSCRKCYASSSFVQDICEKHGKTKFVNKKCKKCLSEASMVVKNCEIHGMVKHQGDSCKSCASMKTAHKRYHVDKFNELCKQCLDSQL